VEELADDEHAHTVPSPTSLDTRIFNADNSPPGNHASSSPTHCREFAFMGQKRESARPIKNEKSIQDSLEYLYEQNNNFINEISNINQLMDHNNSSTSAANGASSDRKSSPVVADEQTDKMPLVDNHFDDFLDQALENGSSSHQDTASFADLIDAKLVDDSVLSMGTSFNSLVETGCSLETGFSTLTSFRYNRLPFIVAWKL